MKPYFYSAIGYNKNKELTIHAHGVITSDELLTVEKVFDKISKEVKEQSVDVESVHIIALNKL